MRYVVKSRALTVARLAVLTILVNSGCASTGSNYKPIVDYEASGKTSVQYEADLKQCQRQSAKTESWDASEEDVMVSAIGSGVIGVVSVGYLNSSHERRVIIQRCMVKNGWVVLR